MTIFVDWATDPDACEIGGPSRRRDVPEAGVPAVPPGPPKHASGGDPRERPHNAVSIRPADYPTPDDAADALMNALEVEDERSARDDAPELCPSCSSDNLIPIVYGTPIAAMFQAHAEGRIELGGTPQLGAPTVRCRVCGNTGGHVNE